MTIEADRFGIAGLANAFLGSTIISVILVGGIIVSFYTVETVGRRTSVLWGGAIMAGVDFAIGGLGFAPATSTAGAVLITLCSIWVFIYSLSLAPIGWTSIVEVSSPRLRAKTAAVATIIQSLSNIVFVSSAPIAPPFNVWANVTVLHCPIYAIGPIRRLGCQDWILLWWNGCCVLDSLLLFVP